MLYDFLLLRTSYSPHPTRFSNALSSANWLATLRECKGVCVCVPSIS